jgi:ribosomal protein L11 methyltransferase
MAAHPPGTAGERGEDRSVRLSVPASLAEEAGAILMDVLGSFEEERIQSTAQDGREQRATLIFYPPADGPSTREELLRLLPPVFAEAGGIEVDTEVVSREWAEGWREHFRPIVIGGVRIRPPWEPPLSSVQVAAFPAGRPLVDVVINPGLGFGTGLHPTTRGTLLLLQEGTSPGCGGEKGRGPLTDAGTGSGILAIAAAKLGWHPIVALDNDPVALISARENVAANGLEGEIEIYETEIGGANERWFRDATVLANMTLEPVSVLVRRLAVHVARPSRLVVSGILAGSQEEQLTLVAHESGFMAGRRHYEEEWVSLELLPRGLER